MGRGRGIRVLEPNWSSGVRVFVSKTIYRTPTAVNPNSSCHPRKTEAPREEMTLLRSQSKLRAESGPEPRTPAPRVSSHVTSCFYSLNSVHTTVTASASVYWESTGAGLGVEGEPQ